MKGMVTVKQMNFIYALVNRNDMVDIVVGFGIPDLYIGEASKLIDALKAKSESQVRDVVAKVRERLARHARKVNERFAATHDGMSRDEYIAYYGTDETDYEYYLREARREAAEYAAIRAAEYAEVFDNAMI